MKQLKALQHHYQLSLLTLAHTPKRDATVPLTRNDLQGSKMLINFCDSAFAIGESHQDAAVRYLKQIKSRNTSLKYHSDQVCLCSLVKRSNFVGFEWLGYGLEADHLSRVSASVRSKRMREALRLKTSGASNVSIARHFGVSEGAVRKWLRPPT